MGITNENFQNEREENPQCATNARRDHSGFTWAAQTSRYRAFMVMKF